MSDTLLFVLLIAAYLAFQFWVLPRFGVPT